MGTGTRNTEKTAVGDKYVAENMMANGYVLGGEQSGHIIFGKYVTTGDGILTSLMVMMTMLDEKMPLSMLVDEMKMYPQCLKNVRVKGKSESQIFLGGILMGKVLHLSHHIPYNRNYW